MEKLLKTTRKEKIRPMLVNNIKNHKRYDMFVQLFEKDEAFRLFARPASSSPTETRQEWKTQFQSSFFSYDTLDEKEKLRFNAVIKRQLKKLYNRALYIYENDPDNQNIFKVLDRVIEIPDYSDINITDENGEHHIVLTRWGAIYDSHNAQTGLIKKLVPLKVKDICLKFVYPDFSPAPGTKAQVQYMSTNAEYTADHTGNIQLIDIPFWEKVRLSCQDTNNETVVEKQFTCDAQDEHIITVPDGKPTFDMLINFKTHDEKPFAKKIINVEINGINQNFTTDENGQIQLLSIHEGTKVNCELTDKYNNKYTPSFENTRQVNYNYQLPKPEKKIIEEPVKKEEPKKTVIEKKTSPVVVEEPVKEAPKSIKIVLTVVDKNDKPVADAEVSVSKLKYISDSNGQVTIVTVQNNVLKVKACKGKSKTEKDIYVSDKDKYSILLPLKPKYFSILPWAALILIFGLVLLFFHNYNANKYKHKVFVSGFLVNHEQKTDTFSKAFKADDHSVILSEGVYDFETDLENVYSSVLDGIAVGESTRIIIYSLQGGVGDAYLDTTGPLIINNLKWKDEPDYNYVNMSDWGDRLHYTFPPERRIWSFDSMHYYQKGSIEVIFLD